MSPQHVPDAPTAGSIKLSKKQSPRNEFLLRTATALIFGPIVLLAIYFGSPWIDVLMLVAGGIMAWELTKLVTSNVWGASHTITVATTPAAIFFLATGEIKYFALSVGIGAIGSLLLMKSEKRERLLWLIVGAIYIPTACGGFILICTYPFDGKWIALWLVAVVIATDIGAYALGKTFGGPKLAPTISPGKTWTGLAGGVIAAYVVGYVVNTFLGDPVGSFAHTGGVIAAIAQTGDLFESALKRSCDVKDTSNILPGHGGLLDRADGFLAVSLVVTVVIWLQVEALLN
ncbi:phosphatidate cytidylyltransferase [Patescibacteria group bacterium]